MQKVKLTESKLKQMILETMQRSANYEKLRTLMGTMEGYFQAESLYEMLRDTFDEEEQMHMDIFFKPLILARERKKLEEKYNEAKEEYGKFYELIYSGEPTTAQEDDRLFELFRQVDLAEEALVDKNSELSRSADVFKDHAKNHPSEAPDNAEQLMFEVVMSVLTGSLSVK